MIINQLCKMPSTSKLLKFSHCFPSLTSDHPLQHASLGTRRMLCYDYTDSLGMVSSLLLTTVSRSLRVGYTLYGKTALRA